MNAQTSTQVEETSEIDRLRSELETLRQSQAQLTDFFENGTVGLHCVDGNGIILRANRIELEMLGYRSEDYVGHHIADFHADESTINEILTRLSAGEILRDFPARLLCADASIREVMINSSVHFEEGRFVHTRCFTRDVTEENRNRVAMQRAQKLESLGVIASGIAHDFNNLLVGVLGNAELAMRSIGDPEKTRDLLERIVVAGRRGGALCDRMLTYAGEGTGRREPVDLNDLAREMQRLLAVCVPKSAVMKLDLTHSLPRIDADPTLLGQVLMNLVTNAAEAVTPDGSQVQITTRLPRINEALGDDGTPEPRVVLEVIDDGCGIPPEIRERIFDPFYTTKFSGRGLGLAAVQGIVTSHDGSLAVESEPGRGTTVRVVLPIAAKSRRV